MPPRLHPALADTWISEDVRDGFGEDTITDFTAGPVGRQDLIAISALGITPATFAASVTIANDGSGSTLVTIGAGSIHVLNVSPSNIEVTDFRLA